MVRILNIYPEGEGYIVYLLLKSITADNTLNVCIRYIDRPIFPNEGKNIALIPQVVENISSLLRLAENIQIFSENCSGLKNCKTIQGDYILSTLKELLKDFDPKLVESVENFQFKVKTFRKELLEKFSFYIPLLIGKRESVVYSWKYYLGLRGIPSVSLLYPRDLDLLKEVIFNPAFGDKLFPLLLGRLPNEVNELLKSEGFVPYQLEIEGKNNLDSELQLIFLAKEVSSKIRKLI